MKHAKLKFLTHSFNLQHQLRLLKKFAASDCGILITGESGTGKELIAQGIHKDSKRANGPFIPVNCGAITETLMESELFGHEGSSFTGSNKEKRPGLFESAHGGTIFLDEIGDASPGLQHRLSEALSEQGFRILGSNERKKYDVRVIAATNKNLEEMAQNGTFNKGLYYRLYTHKIEISPLRDRPSDILPLAEKILKTLNPVMSFSDEAQTKLLTYSWPGNGRELRNAVERSIIMASGDVIQAEEVEISDTPSIVHAPVETNAQEPIILSYKFKTETQSGPTLHEVRATCVRQALEMTEWNKLLAAKILGISHKSVYNYMHKYDITEPKSVTIKIPEDSNPNTYELRVA